MTIGRWTMLAVWAASVPPLTAVAASGEIPLYVGRETCLECHAVDREAAPCELPTEPAHLRAYSALSKPEAAHIAFVSGVAEAPDESLVCLGCHGTGADAGARWTGPTFRIADGVQCEACHAAGSLHVEAHRSGAMGESAARLRRPTSATEKEAACAACHMERPSHREVLEGGYRRPQAQRLYKTPVNLTVSSNGDRLYVVCQNSNSVIVVDPGRGRVVDEIAVGRRPHDAALHPDGRTLYVTNRLSNTLSVIETSSGKVTAELPVGAEPHGVRLDAAGRRVFVLNTGQNTISVVDTRDLTEVTRLAAGAGPWSMAAHPDGTSLLVTNSRSNPVRFRDPPLSELTVVGTGRERVVARANVAGANMLQGAAFVPGQDVVLFTLMRTKNLVPMSRIAQGWVITNGLGVLWPDGRVDQLLLDAPNASFPDPNDVAVSPDGRRALVTSGGSDRVAVVDVLSLLGVVRTSPEHERSQVLPNHLGTSGRFVLEHVPVGHNPRGVAFSPDGRFAFVVNALSDTVTVIETEGFTATAEISLGGPEEITEVRRGERLFHSADNAFGQQFSCRSCHPDGHTNGLAFDIEADGLGLMPVDNRTLRGIRDTAPFKWEGTNPSLARQCGARLAVFFTRLDPFTHDELAALVRYTTTIERPPNPNRSAAGLTLAQRRGQMIFQRTTFNDGRPMSLSDTEPTLGQKPCTSCHSGAYKTARSMTTVGTDTWFDAPGPRLEIIDLDDDDAFGTYGLVYFSQTPERLMPFDVPHLNNIYDSAPYLHNGTALTLEEIWTRFNIYDWHGVTNDLTRRQFNDLIAYLKAL
jgi:YVTN family beta-propeller protein